MGRVSKTLTRHIKRPSLIGNGLRTECSLGSEGWRLGSSGRGGRGQFPDPSFCPQNTSDHSPGAFLVA